MNENDQIDDTFMKFFAVADKIRQNTLSKTSRKSVALLESLTGRQQKALIAVFIMTKKTPEGVSLKRLAKRLDMTVPATSVLVESMVQNKMFLRITSQKDRRAICINLGKFGRDTLELLRVKVQESIHEIVEAIEPNDRVVLDRVINQMHQILFAQDE